MTIIRTIYPDLTINASVEGTRLGLVRCARKGSVSRERLNLPLDLEAFEAAEGFLARTLIAKPFAHRSLLRHSHLDLTVKCSRIVSHQIVRHHQGWDITQSSTRYVKLDKRSVLEFIIPPDADDEPTDYEVRFDLEFSEIEVDPDHRPPFWLGIACESILNYELLLQKGWKRESSRYVIAPTLAATLEITANLEAARWVSDIRTHKSSSPEIQELFHPLRLFLRKVSPVLTYGMHGNSEEDEVLVREIAQREVPPKWKKDE